MPIITIQLSDESFLRLSELAVRSGVTPEELVRTGVEQWLSNSKVDGDDCSKNS